jgi:serine/threonine protein kinase
MTDIIRKYPDPGSQYRIKERLGGGAWKTAYRATPVGMLEDVALLYFRDESQTQELINEIQKLMLLQNKKYSEYVAELKGYSKGKDGKYFLIEELIRRPLDALAPLDDMSQFTKIARDLCRGLMCIHSNRMVHRDLKLDNCGVDRQGRAKIFDLGSITSEPGDIRATILTRAPELFRHSKKKSSQKFDKAADVWALGATLYALRVGEYPFVHKNEITTRRQLNDAYTAGEIDEIALNERKTVIDDEITARILNADSEQKLLQKIHENFRGRAEDIIKKMLMFEIKQRVDLVTIHDEWSSLSREIDGAHSSRIERNSNRIEQVNKLLEAAVAREISLTSTQVDKIYSSVKDALEAEEEIVKTGIEDKFKLVKSLC